MRFWWCYEMDVGDHQPEINARAGVDANSLKDVSFTVEKRTLLVNDC